jgi:hypothetical protein
MKDEGRSFVLCGRCEIHRTWTGMLQVLFLVSLESSRWWGVHGLGSMAFGLAVQKFLNSEWFLHWKLNKVVAGNFRGIGTCLWCWWKDLDEQDLMEFIWYDWDWECTLIFKWFLPLKIQINSKKPLLLEGKSRWGRGNTWAKGHRPH